MFREHDLDWDDSLWEDTGAGCERFGQTPCEPWHRVSGPTLNVAGTHLHVEGYAVVMNEHDERVAAHPTFQSDIDALYQISDCALMPATIRGREYLLCAFPFGD